jgi:hypothetical protein
MKPKSDNLFHFTKNIDFLKSILLNGFYPRYCLEDTKWLNTKYNFLGYPMICFCDIPISRISDHTAFYGDYGLGLTKSWGLTNKLIPVIYTPAGSAVTQVIDYLLDIKHDGDPNKEEKDQVLNEHTYKMLTLIKPITGQMYIGGSVVEKDFYQENEWRHVPPGDSILFPDAFAEERDAKNTEMQEHKLSISPQDIKYIFVKYDHEIPDLVDFINTNLGGFRHNDLKLLSTRILSLETISADL